MENTPVVFHGHPLLVRNSRSFKADEQEQAYSMSRTWSRARR